ncbi:putative sugar transport-like membrane protein [Melioribacter roseus P3M-2]|uniref:Putative sugar transport-like membrane protein n=1 Tax=Melioribacter roseus (strain DSM 23840 / JCM 17771 / VKM B-2668 / P3M-2) TaxID=1191523 RepID=I6ZRY1_MELRP|nr:MFS transporter [Melioribacter roseus]AFN74819.1 putative sugar transport-like membrane protein [Melioribacter roseus P3M-2]
MKSRALPVYLAFLCMGFGDVVGPLVGLAKDSFSLSYTMAQLIPFTGFIMFGILSVPIGIFQDRKGRKFVLLLGLTVALIGLLLPILNGMYGLPFDLSLVGKFDFLVVLASILLLCAGATILQVVGNPIMRDVSPEGAYSRNLSLAQSLKAVGSSMGFLIPPFAAYVFKLEWTILFPLFASLILITLLITIKTDIHEKEQKDVPASIKSCFELLKKPYVLIMVLAIFFYVGAEVSMSSGVPILLKENFGVAGFSLWVSWSLFFLPIMAGRFFGSLILRKIEAQKFLRLTVVISFLGIALMFTNSALITFVGIILTGLGFSNIFPLVFSITIEKMPERSNELSGLMVTAIAGGAVVPLIMGAVNDLSDVLTGFIIPLLCVIYIGIASVYSSKIKFAAE